MKSDLMMPPSEPSGFIKTLNNMGFMTSALDPFSQEFVDFSPLAPGPSLDIGAAYGIATLAVLAKGERVIANDIDERHLQILKSRPQPADRRKLLTLLPGRFPDLDIQDRTIGSILVCRVLHFFTGEQIERSFKQMYQWLNPKGRIFIVAETPYLRNFQKFHHIYEERLATGVRWPGFIEDVLTIAPERGAFLPRQMHLLDPLVLQRTAIGAGFRILKCQTIARHDFPPDLRWDGRESVGMLAEKVIG